MKSIIPAFILPAIAITSPAYAVQYLTVTQAQSVLYPQATAFSKHFVKMNDDQRDAIETLSDIRQRWQTQKIWKAYEKGRFKGWFIVDKVIGKHEFITYAVALSPQGTVLGVEVMDYRETYGDEIREADWRAHFVGADKNRPLALEEDIPNISGATLSCRNVTNGIKRLLALYEVMLKP
ncbi:MAG: FMN-binding protein [Hydrogenovibrio sp.]|nr:FMN-binding protein [Hydrogenovibrio sp.]